jgi:integral membrane sensor domain MASE1
MGKLRGNERKPFYVYLLILVVTIIINLLLARFAVITTPVAPGVSSLFIAIAFMIAFTLWFGLWGAIAAYIGTFIGAGLLSGVPLDVNSYWALADLWQVLIPLVAFRTLNANVGLKTKKDFLIFLIFGWILSCLVGAIWGSTTLILGGIALWNEFLGIFTGWFVGDLIVTIVITTLLLRFVTPSIKRYGLYVKGYWV